MEKKWCTFFRYPAIHAGVAAFCAGIATHMFALTNVLQNYDNITASFNGFGSGVDSGRWFLTFISMGMHKFFGGYNLPWFNGVIAIFLLAVSAAFLASTLRFRKTWTAVLLGILFAIFPTAASILFFRFVSMYDALAILLAVIAAWVLSRHKWGLLISACCTACSMGIYQAYFPITVTTLVVLLIRRTAEGEKFTRVFKNGVLFLLSLAAGLVAYFVCQKAVMLLLDAQLNNYQGIATMGQIDLERIPQIVASTYASVFKIPFSDYCDIAPNLLAKCLVGSLGILSILMNIMILCMRKCEVKQWLLAIMLWAVFPIAINLIAVMAPESNIYTMMVYSFVFLFITPLVLVDAGYDLTEQKCFVKVKPFLSKLIVAVAVLVSLAALNYMYLDNANYTAMYYTTKQTENYFNNLVTQVRMTEGYQLSQEWAFIGDRFNDPLLEPEWGEVPLYGGNDAININAYSRMRWIKTYVGYDIPLADEDTIKMLEVHPEVTDMPCFPDEGSIRIINNTVVIKLEEPAT